jgi:PKD domain
LRIQQDPRRAQQRRILTSAFGAAPRRARRAAPAALRGARRAAPAHAALRRAPRAAPAALRGALATLILAGALLAACPHGASAVILPAATLDGPGEDIVGFGGAAMAADGSGGVVYLKRVDGVAHVFVSRIAEGRWLPPVRVDVEAPYPASWPRIGAAEDGELIVVWATPFATREGKPVYELVGSLLASGSSAFGPAVIVDPDIEEATGTSPDLAVSSTGQADVVYRVVKPQDRAIPLLRPGDVAEEVRVAHFDGYRWSNLGAVNRDTGVSMRSPTSTNAPQIAIGPTGNGIVVWQEPNIEGVARIWARRLFGSTLDYVLPVSSETYGGTAIGQDADAPAIGVSWLGQADVAYRQTAGPGSPLPGPRIFLNILPSGESMSGAEFLGPTIADAAVPGGSGASVGPPSIDIDEQEDVRIVYDANGTPRVVEGNDHGLSGTLSLGPAFAGAEPVAASVMNPQGGGVSAWPSADAQGDPAVAVREDFPSGAVQTGLVSGGAGGSIDGLAVGRSGLGDGLIAFQQGPLGDAAIIADQVSAPPAELVLSAPRSWVRPSAAMVTWQPAVSGAGPLRYNVVLDGRELATPAGVTKLRLDPRGLGSGRHRIQLLATDVTGGSTLSKPSELLIDGQPPTVAITRLRRGHAVKVRVSDAGSGVNKAAVRISFGDGHSARGRAKVRHRYAHEGVYEVVAYVRDKLGNQATVRRLVRVR